MKTSPRFRSLRWRILFWTALVALGPLVIMAGQGYHCARQAIVESQEKHLRSVIESRKAEIESRLQERKAVFSNLGESLESQLPSMLESPEALATFQENGRQLFDTIQECSPSCSSLVVFDLDWSRMVKTSERQVNSFDLAADFKARLNGATGLVVSHLQVDETGETRLFLGRSLLGGSGRKLGYLVAELGLAAIADSILRDPAGLGETGKIYILSSDDTYLTAPAGSGDLVGEKAHAPKDLFSPEASPVLEYRDHQGVEVLGTAVGIPELDWVVVAEIDQEEAFGWLGKLQFRALATGSVTLILVLLVSMKTAERLSQPLRRLAATAHRIAHGRHEERLEPLQGTEAEEVAQAFNKMLDELEASHQRLVHAASLAAIGQLSSSIVHEMRNPLSSVKMNVQALQRKVKGDPTYSELADIAMSQVSRLERMSTDLLNYGKPLELRPVAVEFGDLAREVVQLLAQETEAKGITIQIEDGLRERGVFADPEQLRQALTNLLLNAAQNSPDGGRVIVSAHQSRDEPERLVISVSDEGPGIPEGQKENLFQPFFTTRPGGTGLGLANVRKIIEYHGGTIVAEDRAEGGAVFTIRLPRGGPTP